MRDQLSHDCISLMQIIQNTRLFNSVCRASLGIDLLSRMICSAWRNHENNHVKRLQPNGISFFVHNPFIKI